MKTLISQAIAFAFAPLSAVEAEKGEVPAVRNQMQKGLQDFVNQQTAVVIPLAVRAEEEAEMIHVATQTRAKHWATVINDWKHDMPELEKYPSMVRHAYAKKLGLNMSISRSKWDKNQRKLYDAFSANQVSNLGLMISLAKEGPEATQRTLELLTGPGTLPAKVLEARIQLGKPVKARGTKERTDAPEGEKVDPKAPFTPAESVKSGKGADKWDMTELRKKSPLEVVILLVASALKPAELDKVVRGITARLVKDADPLNQVYGQMIQAASEEFDRKNDDDGEELEAETDLDFTVQKTGTNE